ncbi:thioredoxin family protein [Lutibacter sp.]
MNNDLFLPEAFDSFIQNNTAVLAYFSTTSCSVGEAVEPKVKNLLQTHFPKLKFVAIDLNFAPEVTAKYTVFVEPTILVFFEGKEAIRMSRNISIEALKKAIDRLYQLIFE